MGSPAEDLSGKRFGQLVVLHRVASPGTVIRGVFWQARCDCGQECQADGRALRRGVKRSCGCLRDLMGVWTPERDAVLRAAWAAGIKVSEIHARICRIQPHIKHPPLKSVSTHASELKVPRPPGYVAKLRAGHVAAKAPMVAKPSRKPAPVMRRAPAPQPVVIAVEVPTREPLSKEAAWESARQIVSRKRDLSSIDVAEVAKLSGMSRFYPRLRQQMALTEIRMVIGQVRAARYEVGGAA